MRKGFIALLMVLLLSLPTLAQENILIYGDSVQGEITNREFEVEYTFKGTTGDLITARLAPDDNYDGLTNPALLLLSPEGDVLETINALYAAAEIFYSLPEDGEYVLLASRRDGRSGDSQGGYTLTLDVLPLLTESGSFEGTADNEIPFYIGVSTTSDFTLTYTRTGGSDFFPQITVNQLEQSFFSDNNLSDIAMLSGSALETGSLGVSPQRIGKDLFVISVGAPMFGFYFSVESVEFVLDILIED